MGGTSYQVRELLCGAFGVIIDGDKVNGTYLKLDLKLTDEDYEELIEKVKKEFEIGMTILDMDEILTVGDLIEFIELETA